VADTTVGFDFEACRPQTAAGAEVRPKISAADQALVRDLRAGAESAYETLIQQFEQPVYNIASRLLDDPAEAADVVQEVFLKIFRNIGMFREESSLKTWIYRIAVNEARNHHRWFSRHCGQEVDLEPAPGETHGYQDWVPDPAPSPFEKALDHETRSLIEEALSKVNPKYRAALVLREIEDLPYDEIAEILQISLGTVKSRILRGREALRKHLAERLEPAPAALPLAALERNGDLAL
jgi:RNA polymerase sigma-70 factor, ECF subfamily